MQPKPVNNQLSGALQFRFETKTLGLEKKLLEEMLMKGRTDGLGSRERKGAVLTSSLILCGSLPFSLSFFLPSNFSTHLPFKQFLSSDFL